MYRKSRCIRHFLQLKGFLLQCRNFAKSMAALISTVIHGQGVFGRDENDFISELDDFNLVSSLSKQNSLPLSLPMHFRTAFMRVRLENSGMCGHFRGCCGQIRLNCGHLVRMCGQIRLNRGHLVRMCGQICLNRGHLTRMCGQICLNCGHSAEMCGQSLDFAYIHLQSSYFPTQKKQ